MSDYKVLHYRGDVTRGEPAGISGLLGHDQMGRFYEVIDAEYDASTDRTTVRIQHASPEAMRAATERSRKAVEQVSA